MPGKYKQDLQPEKGIIRMVSLGWLKLNLYYSVLGVVIGIILSLLFSAIRSEWIGWQSFIFHTLLSTTITLCISNCIYLSHKLIDFNRKRMLLLTIAYYASSIIGVLIAIEIVFLIHSWIFKTAYHFFHFQEALFCMIIAFIICTIIFIYSLQKWGMKEKLQKRDLDVMRLKQMKTQAELAALQSKINPHFLYNSLNAIASLIHEDPDKAERMTIQLSKLFRYSINQNQENLVLIKEEMEIVSTYLEIEKVRFGERINFIIEIDETLLYTKIPRFLIQPLVENALKHGLKNVAKDAELRIVIKKQDHSNLVISISDNGIPFPDELEVGYGLQSTYDKLNLLYEQQYELQIINSPVKQIKIQLPLTHG